MMRCEVRLGEVTVAALQARGLDAHAVDNVAAALSFLNMNPVRLVLTDLRMPGLGGRDLLASLQAARPEMPVVIMTAYASVRDAVALIREGDFDYIAKPSEIEDVVATIGRALKLRETEEDNRRLRQELREKFDFGRLLGTSEPFQRVLKHITDVCDSPATVLFHGEGGTGKQMIDRAIHDNSRRRDEPFIDVNCATIPENLMESELFGHVRGTFTGAIATREGRFALAHGGTLFLDEIGDMPLALQAKVLRAIQEQSFELVGGTRTVTVDVRFIAATHRDLRQEAAKGNFREDLYYRLNVFPITVPALREREADIEALSAHFLARYAASIGKRLTGFSRAALTAMSAYPWPGNIRELQNCIERAVIVAQATTVDFGDLPPYLFEGRPKLAPEQGFVGNLDEELERIERDIVTQALRDCGGIQARAAEGLGITERSLWHRVKKLGIRITRGAE
ncbi:sigma-54-dependent transcriptional regulator [Niveispirillum cyanobacteriorum]|uniref:Sigma-54-dependent Fis family transcriptional regulator n=1 Tax=Niveispirillum cyanobacteriorum TaxID=1612173 RepID=A0A2K9NHL5_9PROT|nr:sigma-54 dependent transcriptional regulator [Niveispirillum cyanobacteriorum]AUN32580.1 sigma-54-dependent Fis family transcriptional regulator [Niveispirillum cyanobacteriorum]